MSNGRTHRRRVKAARRPDRTVLEIAARFTAATHGCTCAEIDMGQIRHGDITTMSVGHDEGCPAGNIGGVYAAIVPGRP